MATTGTWKLQLGAALVAVTLMSLLVLRVSSAAFTATTENAANNWETGTIALSDDDTSSAMFNMTGMVPGSSETKCIEVTYTGDADPDVVKLYASVTDNGLADHLDVTVTEGDGGVYGDCSGFVAGTAIVNNKTLTGFGTDHSAYGNGAGTWDPAASAETKTYQFTVTLGADTPGTVQNADAQATFTWETTTTAA